MRFHIDRTSGWDDSEKPCEEAVRGTYTRIDVRTVDAPEKVPAFLGKKDWWYEIGENHRVVNGQITRDFPNETDWFIELNSLDDLLAFIAKYGRVVVGRPLFNQDEFSIEIYDTYRE